MNDRPNGQHLEMRKSVSRTDLGGMQFDLLRMQSTTVIQLWDRAAAAKIERLHILCQSSSDHLKV